MTTNRMQTAAEPRYLAAARTLLGPLLFAVIMTSGYFTWHKTRVEAEQETEMWMRDVMREPDPWKRHDLLERGFHAHTLTDDQRRSAYRQTSQALEQALAARTAAAFDLIETQGFSDLLDKYPRDPARRQLQLDALALLWPDIASRPYPDRMILVRIAERCHLHEAPPPVARQTVLDCIQYGANSLGRHHDLNRLMDTAVLGEPITEAAK